MAYNKQKFLKKLHKGIKIHRGLVAGTRCGLCGKPIAKRDIERYMAGNLKVCRTCFNTEGKIIKVLVRGEGSMKGTPMQIASLHKYKVVHFKEDYKKLKDKISKSIKKDRKAWK